MGCLFLYPSLAVASYLIQLDSIKVVENEKNFNFLKGGHVGILSNGMIRSSTNLFRFNVGHPRKYFLPFYLNLGANVDIKLSENVLNETAAFDLLNNMGGLLNFGVDGNVPVKLKSRTTSMKVTYQMALKSINGFGREGSGGQRFLSQLISTGLLIKSTAWNPNNPKQKGEFWVKNTIGISLNPSEVIIQMWGDEVDDTFFNHTFETGLVLQDGLNLKFTYYQFINNRDVVLIKAPSFKFSANVLLR